MLRSYWSMNMAMVHPSPGVPIIRSIGTRTPSKNVSHISSRPLREPQRSAGHPRAVRVDQQRGQAAVPALRRAGPHQGEDPVGQVPVAGPHLLPVHDDDVALDRSTGPERGEVAPRVGLGEALPPEVVTGQERREERFRQRRRELEQRRRHDLDRLVGVRHLQAGEAELVVVRRPVARPAAEPADRFRPSHPLPTCLPQGATQRESLGHVLGERRCARVIELVRGAQRATRGTRAGTR